MPMECPQPHQLLHTYLILPRSGESKPHRSSSLRPAPLPSAFIPPFSCLDADLLGPSRREFLSFVDRRLGSCDGQPLPNIGYGISERIRLFDRTENKKS